MRIAVNVSHLSDEMLSFFGFALVRQSKEFKIYRDWYNEEHIATRARPFVFVDNEFDADAMRSDMLVRVESGED